MDDNPVALPETPAELAAREERMNSARKRTKEGKDNTRPGSPEKGGDRTLERIRGEAAEGERLRALGPEPTPEITEAQLVANPSDYLPGIEENRRRALEAEAAPDEHAVQAAAARQAMLDEERGGVAPELARPAVAPVPVEHVDTRQLWVCVGADGIRSVADGAVHAAFRSDAHLLGEMVACPHCAQTTVRKVDPNEDLRLDEERAIWATMAPHQRELVMAQRRAALTAPR